MGDSHSWLVTPRGWSVGFLIYSACRKSAVWTCLFPENSPGVQHEPLRDPQGSYSAVWAVTPVSLLGRPTVIPRHLHELGDRPNLTLED